MESWKAVLVVGLVATGLIDIWAMLRRRLFGVPTPNYGLLGRWLAHMPLGRFRHDAIADAACVRGERFIGWLAHYLIGFAFAAAMLGIAGPQWLQHPSLVPALMVGIGTVAMPFLLMQPGMGAGIAASRSARPNVARLQSLITHAIFGLGLYLGGWIAKFVCPV